MSTEWWRCWRIRSAFSLERSKGETPIRLTGCTVDLKAGVVARADDQIRLTTKEAALLAYFAEHPEVELPRELLLGEV
ncbi:MAG: hypothetical protein CME06_10110 [Gemmatimonadetes bacterium]|nr:hypothetical protein [Gemmatimonadota bacterium]